MHASWSIFAVILLYLASAAAFWLPGQLVADHLARSGRIAEIDKAPAGLITSLLIGYGGFVAYWTTPALGKAYSGLVLLIAVIQVAASIGRSCSSRSLTPIRDALPWWSRPMLLVGLAALALLFSHGAVDPAVLATRFFFESVRPPDSYIPLSFANALVRHDASLHGVVFGDWSFADRPPLEAAIVAVLWPLRNLGTRGLFYQCAGTMLQTLWVPAMAWLAERLGYSRAKAAYAIMLTAANGLVFYESVYLWPKLVAGAVFLIVLLPLVSAWRERRRVSSVETALIGTAALCAMLMHGAVGYSAVALAVVLLPIALRVFSWRGLAVATAIVVVGYLPWLRFQAESAQAGNRLAKMHLAGVYTIDQRSAAQVIVAAYRGLTFKKWMDIRRDNLAVQIGSSRFHEMLVDSVRAWRESLPNPAVGGLPIAAIDPVSLDSSWSTVADLLRVAQREYLVPALDVIWVGWLLIPLLALSHPWRRHNTPLLMLALFSLWSFAVWCTIEFVGGGAVLTHVSFALVLSAALIGAAVIYDLGRIMRGVIFILHLAIFVVVWVSSVPGPYAVRQNLLPGGVDLGFVLLGLVAIAGIGWWWWRVSETSIAGVGPKTGYNPSIGVSHR